MTSIKLNHLTDDEKCVLSVINGIMGPTSLAVGGEYAESVLCQRAALAMLSLIGRGLITAQIFNNTGRVVYRPTELAAPLKGKVSVTFLEKHGRWSITEPNANRKGN